MDGRTGFIWKGAVLLNFSRDQTVDSAAVVRGLQAGRIGRYFTDFPVAELIGNPKVVQLPHLGASTREAEENCTIMAAGQLRDFLEHGNIKNLVNFSDISLERSDGYRLVFSNRNVPKMLNSVLSVLAERDINVIDMINTIRDEVAYNITDIQSEPNPDMIDTIEAINGVIKVRTM